MYCSVMGVHLSELLGNAVSEQVGGGLVGLVLVCACLWSKIVVGAVAPSVRQRGVAGMVGTLPRIEALR